MQTPDFRARVLYACAGPHLAPGAKTAAHALWPREVCIYVLSVVGVVLQRAGGEAVEIVLSKSLQCQVVFLWKSTMSLYSIGEHVSLIAMYQYHFLHVSC